MSVPEPALDRLRLITEALNQEFTPAELLALVERSPDGIVIVNGAGEIVFVNGEAELISGYNRAELLGQSVDMLLPDGLRLDHQNHRSGYMKEPRTRTMGANRDLALRTRDGDLVPILISLAPVPTSKGLRVAAYLRRRREPGH